MLESLLDGLTFTEAPRWHDGRLWFSDFYTQRVIAVDPDGRAETMLEVPQRPSGLGWMPDGSLLVVSMLDRRLLRVENGRTRVHAEGRGNRSCDCGASHPKCLGAAALLVAAIGGAVGFGAGHGSASK